MSRLLTKTSLSHPQTKEAWVCFCDHIFQVTDAVVTGSLLENVLVQETTTCVIVPLDETAGLQWQLPVPLARLIAAPTNSAFVYLCSAEADEIETIDQVWQFVVDTNPDQIAILDRHDLETHAREFPLLSPREGKPPQWLRPLLDNPPIKAAHSSVDAVAIKAGLSQLHDALHQSHGFSQSIEGEGPHRAGDYWHAIMHRREPDFGNSKYWFRLVGQHPIFDELARRSFRIFARSQNSEAKTWQNMICKNGWNPSAFVDLAEHCRNDEASSLAMAAREIQWTEMLLLLSHTYHAALSE